MKVECIQLISATTGERAITGPWLTVGRTYTVLAIQVGPGREITLRIVSDDGHTPGLYASTQFETVDDRIPPEWVAQIDDTGALRLAPRAWLRPGFWEDFFDGSESAAQDFNLNRRLIESAD